MEKETSRPSVNLASDALNNQVLFLYLVFGIFLYFVFPPVLLTTRFVGDENNLEAALLTITVFILPIVGRVDSDENDQTVLRIYRI